MKRLPFTFRPIVYFLVLPMFFACAVQAQVCKGAIVKDRLMLAVRANLISKKTLVSNIKLCGVDFQMNAQNERELKAVGASDEMIEAARGNYRGSTAKNNASNAAAAARYDEILTLVSTLVSEMPKEPQQIIERIQKVKEMLQQAIALDSERSEAYSVLGLLSFAIQSNADAEKNARSAIERGGAAIFPVSYESEGSSTEGVFFISQGALAFQSSDEQQSLQGDSSGFVRVRAGGDRNSNNPNAFSIEYLIDGAAQIFTFAPTAGDADGADLMMRLINESVGKKTAAAGKTIDDANKIPNVPHTVSGGVLNGKAVNLVTPVYPAAARAVRASGAVNVQVTIDEQGKVVSATAVSGHPLLRQAAEQAARASAFSPTVMSGQAVKVTGIIVFNFIP